MFDAGALIYRIQVIGAEVAQRAIKDQDAALDKAGKTAKQTGAATEDLGRSQQNATKSTKSFGQELTGLSEKGVKAGREVGAAMLGVGAAVAAMVVGSVAKFGSFSAQLAQVQTLSHANEAQMQQLSEAALTSGQNIGLSANEVAEAETELVKAGVGVTEQMGGALTGALNLAAAGQIDVAKSTQIAAVAMTQFHLAGKDVPHLADLLAAGADKALGGVDDLGMALNQSGLVASQFGLSIEDTVGTLSAFANAGLLGSDAGTSFKTMLLSLASPSQQATDLMKKYNIEAYDAQGNFIGITALAGKLANGLKTASQAERDHALSVIFGTDAIRAANVLYKEGATGIQGWVDKVNDSGFAAEQAQGKLDSLNGDVGKLGAAFDSALIQTGTSANDVLRSMVQILTAVVQWYNGLPGPVHTAALAFGTGTAAAALFGGTMLLTVPKIAEFRAAVATLNKEMPRTSGALRGVGSFLTGPWGAALAAGAAAITLVIGANQQWQDEVNELTSTLDEQTGAVSENSRAWVAKKLQDKGVADSASRLGLSLATITDAAMGNQKAMKEVQKATDAYRATMGDTAGTGEYFWTTFGGSAPSDLASEIQNMNGTVEESKKKFAEQKVAANESAASMDSNGESTSTAATAYADAADKAGALVNQLDDLIDTINKANGVGQDAVSTNASYQQALADVQDTIAKAQSGTDGYSTSLDQSTEAGSKNAAMFSDLAAKSQDAAQAQYNLDHDTAAYQSRLEGGRQALIDQITALTGNRDAAIALADSIYRIPTQREFKMLADTQTAQAAINGFINQNDGRRIRMYVDAYGGQAYQIPGTNVRFRKDGGVFPSVQYFADGTENHRAQIAKAGAWRVWAEPETGGEAYIPLAQSKRGRSTQILGQVAGQFGYALVPTGAQHFADGDSGSSREVPAAQGLPTRSRPSLQITVVNPIARDPMKDIREAGETLSAAMSIPQ